MLISWEGKLKLEQDIKNDFQYASRYPKERKCGIYKITNLINGNIYIGQSVNIYERWYNHKCTAYKKNDKNKYAIHYAIKNYGIENFAFEIIEETTEDKLNEREIYWIAYYDSYNNGYNLSIGGNNCQGENNPRALLTKEDVIQIRTMYGQKIKRKEVYELFKHKITKRGFQHVWLGEHWSDIMPEVYTEENRLWHFTKAKANVEKTLSKEEISLILLLRQQGMSYEKIAKQVGRAANTCRKYCVKFLS